MNHVLFDFDGTIADSEKAALDIMSTLADRHGIRMIAPEEIEKYRKMPIKDRFKQLKLPMRKLPGWAKEYNHLFQESVGLVSPFQGIPEMLSSLYHQGYIISIISSNAENNIRRFLEKHQLDFITDVHCSHHVFSKDRMIKRLLRKWKLQSEDVVYVGDEHRDVVACKKAGVKVIWVRWGFDGHEAVMLENPDFVAEKPSDILGFVGAIA